jgi:two-component system, OmpR family, alkaline phosphatase synthesis response regulator PhoP
MSNIALVFATEAGGVLEHDLESFGIDVAASPLSAADQAFAAAEIDAYVVEAPQATDDLRRIVEAAGRQPKTPLILVLRPDQLQALDPSWAVDDFVLLPVAAQELILRLRRSIWRRRGIDAGSTVHVGDLLVDLSNYKVFVSEQPVTLTFKEFELLRFLMTNRGKVFTREALLNRVWGYEYFGGARTVDVHIRRLRSKIETGSTVYIETVRNVGYRFPIDV